MVGVQGEGAGPQGREVARERERYGQVRWEIVSGGRAHTSALTHTPTRTHTTTLTHTHIHTHTPSHPHSTFRERTCSSNPSFCSKI